MTNTDSVSESIRLRLQGNEDYLRMLANERAAGFLNAALFQERASRYVADHPELICINWVDAGFRITDVAPLASNRQILGLRLELPEPKRASRLARERREPVYTRPFVVIQGKLSIELWVPVFRGNVFLGVLGGIYSCEKLLHTLVPAHVRATHHVSLLDAAGTKILELPAAGVVDERMTRQASLTPGESGLLLRLQGYDPGNRGWIVPALEVLCLALVLAMTYAMWSLKRQIAVRRSVESALRESEKRYKHLLGSVTDYIYSVEILNGSPAAAVHGPGCAAVTGYAPEDYAADPDLWSRIVYEPNRKAVEEQAAGVRAGNAATPVEHQIRHRDGSLRWVRNTVVPRYDQQRRLIAYDGLIEDITERKKAEEALKRSEAFIKNILESVDEGFIVLDRDFTILSANHAFIKLVGNGDGVVGKHCYEVYRHDGNPCDQQGDACSAKKAFATGEPHGALHKHSNSGGKPLFVEIKAYPVKDESGEVVSVIETETDVTEKMKLEDQLRQAQKMEAIGQLAGGVAHDFNNILTAIIGYGNILKMNLQNDDPQQITIDQILASADRAAHLTQGLLAFGRKQIITPRAIDLNEIVKCIAKLLRRLIGEDIELSTSLAGGSLVAMADASQIEQVLMNLATNARDAMPGGGSITISTQELELTPQFVAAHGFGKPGRYALITVSDTGFGMDEKTREKIFDPFFTTKEVGKGTGLGLAIVYGIVKQHDGIIKVYSEPGNGSTFRIYLPLASVAAEKNHAQPTVLRGGTETILLAEDDVSVRELTAAILSNFGYRVIDAVNGQDAVDKYQTHAKEIDLLLLDVIMPKKSGKDVYDTIRAWRPGIKTLFISGYTADIMHKRGIFEEGVQFISKPARPAELLGKIRELLDEKQDAEETVRSPQ